MPVQTRVNLTNEGFVLWGDMFYDAGAVLATDAGRTVDLARFTLMAKVAASGEWVPLTDITAIDGSAIPLGILMSETVPFATIAAGTVPDQVIMVGHHVIIDENLLVMENSVALDDVIIATSAADNVFTQTVKDYLANIGIFASPTEAINNFENA